MNDEIVTVSGIDEAYYVLEQGTEETMPTITIKDRLYTLEAVKLDGGNQEAIAGVTFALHRQVTVDGMVAIDLNPMPGYETLVTGADGVIPKVDNTLPSGSYELREKTAPEGYEPLASYIQFTVSESGAITLGTHPEGVEFADSITSDGTLQYVLTINNYARIRVSVWKTDAGHNTITAGASFALYLAEDYDDETETPLEGKSPVLTGTTNGDGLLDLDYLTIGEYRLVETEAPEGYEQASGAIRITVAVDGVTALQGTEISEVALDDEENEYYQYWVAGQEPGTYQIRVWNSEGYQLPLTGGSGTSALYIAGFALIILAAAAFLLKRRAERRRV